MKNDDNFNNLIKWEPYGLIVNALANSRRAMSDKTNEHSYNPIMATQNSHSHSQFEKGDEVREELNITN